MELTPFAVFRCFAFQLVFIFCLKNDHLCSSFMVAINLSSVVFLMLYKLLVGILQCYGIPWLTRNAGKCVKGWDGSEGVKQKLVRFAALG